jgi:hypothetical protein
MQTRPTQGDWVPIREMAPSQPDIAQPVNQQTLSSDSDDSDEDLEDPISSIPSTLARLSRSERVCAARQHSRGRLQKKRSREDFETSPPQELYLRNSRHQRSGGSLSPDLDQPLSGRIKGVVPGSQGGDLRVDDEKLREDTRTQILTMPRGAFTFSLENNISVPMTSTDASVDALHTSADTHLEHDGPEKGQATSSKLNQIAESLGDALGTHSDAQKANEYGKERLSCDSCEKQGINVCSTDTLIFCQVNPVLIKALLRSIL